MLHRNTRSVAAVVGALVLVGTLAACSSGGGTSEPTATRTVTQTADPAPSDTASSAPSSSASSGSGSGGSSDTGGAASGGRCATTDLTGSFEPGSGGAAGSVYVHLALKNASDTACTLQGWPGVSYVGKGNGTQIGAAAVLDRSSAVPHPTVTLAPGEIAVAPLKITNWQNSSNGECSPRPVDGYRVYPPGSKQSLFVSSPGTGCNDAQVQLLAVQAFVPEGQATD